MSALAEGASELPAKHGAALSHPGRSCAGAPRGLTSHRTRTRSTAYPILGYWQPSRSACQVEKSIYSAEYQQVCDLLRQLRHEAGLTQAQVAERLDVPQSFVSKYESGQRRLDIVELRHVAEALGVSVSKILTQLGRGWSAN